MVYYLFDRYSVIVSNWAIHRSLVDAGWSFKIAAKLARQCNEKLCAHWHAKRLWWQYNQLAFIDESALSPRSGDSKCSWSHIELLCLDIQMLRRERRWSMLPAMTIDRYLEDPLVIQGSVTIEAFEEWFEYKVLP